MSLNNINLPSFTIAALFASTLTGWQEKAEVLPAGKALPGGLGKNLKHITVLVSYADETHIPGPQLEFLTNILKACSLTPDDIVIVNTSDLKTGQKELLAKWKPKYLLLFGSLPTEFQIVPETDPFTIKNLEHGILALASPALEELNTGGNGAKLLKSRLWTGLKEMFKM